ncbi:MAG: hypothetical protein KAT75_04270 [Dehalococcoidia bacterium]|nr:hypothetical protein [Dehalococcoidia bacterium]
MEGQERLIYAWTGAEWVKILIDAAGHLQVDVLTSALPAGGATAAHQVTMITALQLIDDLRNALGSVNTDDLQVDIKDIAEGEIKLYAWIGGAWYHLLVESAANPNLRVKLYDGANGIGSKTETGAAAMGRALNAYAMTAGYIGGGNLRLVWADAPNTDASNQDLSSLMVKSHLYGYNGATWDRLRTYLTGILKVGRAETDTTTVRVTGTGGVVAGDHYLYWIDCNPGAGNSVWELTDAIIALQAIVLDHFHTGREGHIMTLDPPMHFTTGIYLETFTNMTSMVFCYR